MDWSLFGDEKKTKRTLGIRDKQILYRNANKRCQNPACKKKIDFDEMQVGHKNAYSKGGSTSLRNSVCLCYRCNKLQGTDSWATFLRKQNVKDNNAKIKDSLESLTINQLKALAKKHNIKVKGTVEESFFETRTKAPTKKQYISKLKGKVTEREISSARKQVTSPKTKKKRKKSKKSEDFFSFDFKF